MPINSLLKAAPAVNQVQAKAWSAVCGIPIALESLIANFFKIFGNVFWVFALLENHVSTKQKGCICKGSTAICDTIHDSFKL